MRNKLIRWIVMVEYWGGHYFAGMFTILAGLIHPAYAALWVWMYLTYQKQEYREIKDTAAMDLKDFMWGVGIGMCGRLVWMGILER